MCEYKLHHRSQICTKMIDVNTNPILSLKWGELKYLKPIEEEQKLPKQFLTQTEIKIRHH